MNMIELTAWFETDQPLSTVQRRLKDHLGMRRDPADPNQYKVKFMFNELMVQQGQDASGRITYIMTSSTDYESAYYGWVRDLQASIFLAACQTLTWVLKTNKMLCQDPYMGLIAYRVNTSFRRNKEDKLARISFKNPVSNRLLYRRADAAYDDQGRMLAPQWKGSWTPVSHWSSDPLPPEAAKVKKIQRPG